MYTTKDKPSLYEDTRGILDACRQVIHPADLPSELRHHPFQYLHISSRLLTKCYVASRQKGIPMAIASRTPTPHVADAFMKKLGKHFLGDADVLQYLPR